MCDGIVEEDDGRGIENRQQDECQQHDADAQFKDGGTRQWTPPQLQEMLDEGLRVVVESHYPGHLMPLNKGTEHILELIP